MCHSEQPLPLHPFQYTQVLSVSLTDRMDVSVHPVQSHASLCHCLLHVHTKTVDELICVCVLASLLFGFCFCFFCFLDFDCLFRCVCVMGLRIGVANQKKTAQLPLKDNGTVINKARTCIKCCWKWRTREGFLTWLDFQRVHFLYNCISHIDGWMLLFCILNRLLSSFCHVDWIWNYFWNVDFWEH